jgi:hypothetical protein
MMGKEMTVRGREVGKGKQENEESRLTGVQLPLRLVNPFHAQMFGINASVSLCFHGGLLVRSGGSCR